MATKKVIVEGSSITASQMKDFWRQVGDGSFGFNNMRALLDGEDPFSLYTEIVTFSRPTLKGEKDMYDITVEQMEEFWKQVRQGKITWQHLQDVIARENPFQEFWVDYGKSFEEMIEYGKFDERERSINGEDYPVSGLGKISFIPKLFALKDVNTMEKEGFVHARIEFLLMYTALRPTEQKRVPIIGLGSVKNERFVPYLGTRRPKKRTLEQIPLAVIEKGSRIKVLGIKICK